MDMQELMKGLNDYFAPDYVQEPVELNSSWIGTGEYEPDVQALTLDLDGAEYTYYGVSPFVADRMFNAASAGTYFNYSIKGYYPYSRND